MAATFVPMPSGTPLLVDLDATWTCATCGKASSLLVPRVVGAATAWVCLGCAR